MKFLLPEIPGETQRYAALGASQAADNAFGIVNTSWQENGYTITQPVQFRPHAYGGTIVIETESPQARSRTPTPARSCKALDVGLSSLLSCCISPAQCSTPSETTHVGSASAFGDTRPALDVYGYDEPPPQQRRMHTLPPQMQHQEQEQQQRVCWGMRETTASEAKEEDKRLSSRGAFAGQRHADKGDSGATRDGADLKPRPVLLEPIMGRCIGLTEYNTMLQSSSRVFGGIDRANDIRDSRKTMFHRQSAALDSAEPTAKEIVDTIVPKTTVEERLKFVDLEFVQDVEKFVEVPEVFYNDIIVEVPQVVEVVKIVPKHEIRENITYVPKFEIKYIPKYVEVPVIKIVDRYEVVDEIHEVLKPVVKKSIVNCPRAVLKKVANTVQKKVYKEKPVSVIKYEDVPIYKQKLEPKIIKEELVNQQAHFIDIPVPYEKPVIKYVDQPYFVNQYRDNVYPVPVSHRVTPVFRQGSHTQAVDVAFVSPYLVTHTSHNYRPPIMNYQAGATHMQGYTTGEFQNPSYEQNAQRWHYQAAHDSHRLATQPRPRTPPSHSAQMTVPGSMPCPPSCPPRFEPQCFFRGCN